MMSAANRSNHQATESHDTVPSGYQKIETDQGTKIVRDSPVSFVRRELNMSPNRQRLWEQHTGTTVLPVSRSFADTSVAPNSQLDVPQVWGRSEEHTSELQSRGHLVCRLLLEKKKTQTRYH